MKKKLISFLLLGVTFSLASCGNTSTPSTSNPTSDSSVETVKEYYLTGDLDLNNTNKLQFSKDGDTYTLSNVVLRRGNSFQIYEKNDTLGFNHLSSSLGFKEGKNGYIRVMNEGIYNISIDANENIFLQKTASSYEKVQLHVGNDQTFDFTMDDQFIYQLKDVKLPYRQSFYITLDDERLSFNDFDYNDLYYSALRFNVDKVQVIQKGNFNFALNFANENALVVTSENLKLPQELPQDVDSYVSLVNSLTNQFAQEGSGFTLKETTYLAEDNSSTVVNYQEGIALNERFYIETSGEGEDATKLVRSNIINDTNYYEITRYENSTESSSLNGYLLGEAQESTDSDSSTIVTLEKKYITLEKAQERMLGLVGKEGTVKASFLYPTRVSHLNSNEHSSIYDTAYYSAAKISASYNGDVGDGMKIIATNTEKFTPSSTTSSSPKAITNHVEFSTDNLGHVIDGKTIVSYYEGNDIFNDKEELLSTAAPYKVVTHEFSYEYETRKKSTSFHIDLSKYVLDEVYLASSINIQAGDTISNASLPIADIDPIEAIDKSNLQIVEFDSAYLTQGKGDATTFTANKIGETSVKIGTLYSNKTYTLNVNIDYKDPSRIDISPYVSSSAEFYVGTTYTYTATISPSMADPAVTVEVSDTSKVQATIDDLATQRANGKASVSLKMLEATDSPVTITFKSVSKPSVTNKITISKILPSLTVSDFAGTFYHYRDDTVWTLTITEDGQANLSSDKAASYDFKIKTEGASAVLDSSDTVSSFTATKSDYNKSMDLRCVELSTMTLKDGTNLKNSIYSYGNLKFYNAWSNFQKYGHMIDSEKNATLEFVSFSFNTYNPPAGVFKITYGDDTYTFTWSASSYGTSGSFSSPSLNDGSASGSVSMSDLTDTSFTLRVYKTWGSPSFDETFNFVVVA